MSIARHKALSARRRRTEGAELDEKIEATIADPANDPEVALQEKDRGELVRRALMRLSIEHREVIDLVYYHEKSVDEVAQILDVPSRDFRVNEIRPISEPCGEQLPITRAVPPFASPPVVPLGRQVDEAESVP